MISREGLIKKYIEFFKSKNHNEIPNSSLVPKNDPTVLFTTAGMHPLIPYLLGQTHPLGKRLVNVQRCIRTQDIEEVGDTYHHTFFEMLGNWSLGDYWKKEAIEWSREFLTKILKIDKEKLAVSCFAGDKDSPRDEESAKIWESFGIKKIKFLGKEDNWWGPAGKTGPCGPDTEMFVSGVEIWNDVFMEYNKTKEGRYEMLKQKNVDTGMGVERTLAVINSVKDDYLTEMFKPIIEGIEHLSKKPYEKNKRAMRIIADHIRAVVFIIADGINPGNTEQGYVLRRLIRRTVINLRKLGFIGTNLISPIADKVFEIYHDYEHLHKNSKLIYREIGKEEEKFEKTIVKGLEIFNGISRGKKQISGEDCFLLYQSYGFPIEITKELADEKGIKIDEEGFKEELEKHQKLSQNSAKARFKSGLADNSIATTRLHTATHLLNESLRKILGDKKIVQKGSNITSERLRFDFNFPRKLTDEEIDKIEELVNAKINEKLKIVREEMPLKKALESGARAEFGAKYPDIVSVYTILDDGKKRGWFSKEICTGPHVKNTSELGRFRIIKEESAASGIRRIKAVLE